MKIIIPCPAEASQTRRRASALRGLQACATLSVLPLRGSVPRLPRAPLYQEWLVTILRDLERIDTSNPPCNERACAQSVAPLLEQADV
jgi:hypothetical protein